MKPEAYSNQAVFDPFDVWRNFTVSLIGYISYAIKKVRFS